jgi:hypothetical protein
MPINYPKPPYPGQKQPMPGLTSKMDPRPDHGETSYKGSGRLNCQMPWPGVSSTSQTVFKASLS